MGDGVSPLSKRPLGLASETKSWPPALRGLTSAEILETCLVVHKVRQLMLGRSRGGRRVRHLHPAGLRALRAKTAPGNAPVYGPAPGGSQRATKWRGTENPSRGRLSERAVPRRGVGALLPCAWPSDAQPPPRGLLVRSWSHPGRGHRAGWAPPCTSTAPTPTCPHPRSSLGKRREREGPAAGRWVTWAAPANRCAAGVEPSPSEPPSGCWTAR